MVLYQGYNFMFNVQKKIILVLMSFVLLLPCSLINAEVLLDKLVAVVNSTITTNSTLITEKDLDSQIIEMKKSVPSGTNITSSSSIKWPNVFCILKRLSIFLLTIIFFSNLALSFSIYLSMKFSLA